MHLFVYLGHFFNLFHWYTNNDLYTVLQSIYK